MSRYIYHPKALLVLLVGVVSLFALSPGPADAAVIFTINSTGDAKDRKINGVCDSSSERGQQCTLRAAIQEANATANSGGPDEINFAIGGTATVKTISPTRPLPSITESVTINGYTQGSTTAITSDDAKPNDNPLTEGSDAVIKVEIRGTNAGANANGLKITASDSTIKGLSINRFAQSGILVEGSGATGNKVEGDFIGTDASGTLALPNRGNGVYIGGAPSNAIGGIDPAQRNLLSGNSNDGVQISGSGAMGNLVWGNYIGLDVSGNQDLGNAGGGVHIENAPNNTIGGAAGGARNVISGNQYGVIISGASATGSKVECNYIGTQASGSQPLGNAADGVLVNQGASNNTIGNGTTHTPRSAGNIISGNGGHGVHVLDGSGNSVLRNAIYHNEGLGIELGDDGVTNNDVDPTGSNGDADTGPNNLQNFPVITQAAYSESGGYATISGELHSTPNQTFIIELYRVSSSEADPSNHGESTLQNSSITTTTDAYGHASFFDLGGSAGEKLTATATNTATGDTSEFSENVDITIVF